MNGYTCEVKDAEKWRRVFSEANSHAHYRDATKKKLVDAAKPLDEEMKRLADRWSDSRDTYNAIKTSTVVVDDKATSISVGPGVGRAPFYAIVTEGGRAPNRKPPPISEGSRFYLWATKRGFSYVQMRATARAIGERGLPKVNPMFGWDYSPPTFVERSLMNKKSDVDAAIGGMAVEFIGLLAEDF